MFTKTEEDTVLTGRGGGEEREGRGGERTAEYVLRGLRSSPGRRMVTLGHTLLLCQTQMRFPLVIIQSSLSKQTKWKVSLATKHENCFRVFIRNNGNYL